MRAFISINIPSNLSDISLNFNELNGIKFKAVENKNIHITLKFLGEIAAKDAEKISDALNFIKDIRRFNIFLKGISAFPNENYVKVLWLNVAEGNREICELQKKIDDMLRFKIPVEKTFVPHLTVARVKQVKNKGALKAFIEKYRDFEFLKFPAEKISLMKSELRKEGPTYSEIQSFPLKN